MQFLRVSRRKNRRFFLAGLFFLVLYMIFLSKCPNSINPINTSNIWNCEPNIRYRAETVKDHFKKDTYKQTMQKDTVTTEITKYDS